jgi:TPR repeat protein
MNRFLPLLCLCFLSQGCVYVPPVWDAFDAIQRIDRIEPGVTTRKEVLSHLGDPDNGVDSAQYLYSGKHSAGFLFIPNPIDINYSIGEIVGEQSWWVAVDFDESGFVEAISAFPNPLHKAEVRENLAKRADQGDVQARYELGRWSLEPKKWQSLCLAANQGHAGAQYQIGRRFETASIPDHLTAFMWYTTSATGELPAAPSAVKRVSQFLTPEQKTMAERQAVGVEPVRADACEQLADLDRKSQQQAELVRRQAKLQAEIQAELVREREIAFAERLSAAECGNALEQYHLGLMFRTGTEPAIEDAVTAYKWLSLATRNGHEEAEHTRAVLATQMTDAQMANAEWLVAEWQPNPNKCTSAG